MKKESKTRRFVGAAVRFMIASVSMAIVLYLLFALVFSTREEKALQRENRLYRSTYSRLSRQEKLIADAVKGLQEQDNAIYTELFRTQAPSPGDLSAADLIADSDTLSESFYLNSTADASERLMKMASSVDANFADIFSRIAQHPDSLPPLSLPLKDMSYVQTGASVGVKQHPVHKLGLQHDGLDLIAPQGSPVYAAASGTVSNVTHSRKGLGNVVVIDHGNGYESKYCLLADVLVTKGRNVKKGQQIGTVGITMQAPAPHLHYEVLFKGKTCDPVHYLGASVNPEDYSRMLYMSVRTAQSLD